MAEEIDADLALEPVLGGLAPAQRHDAGIVDQYVERGVLPGEPRGEGAHRSQAVEIERRKHRAMRRDRVDARGRFLAFRRRAAGEHDRRPQARQFQRRVIADAAVGTGDHDQFAVHRQGVVRRPRAALRRQRGAQRPAISAAAAGAK